jgi:hypothetical protein
MVRRRSLEERMASELWLQGSKVVVPSPEEAIANPCVSYWLKAALETALHRDPLDAAQDAELLAVILEARARKLICEGPGRSAAN